MNSISIHQGDVILEPIGKLPSDAKFVRENIVQSGELTGHAHVVNKCRVFSSVDLGMNCVDVIASLPMTHEDHPHTNPVPVGLYRVRIQEEYFPDGSRQVQD